MAAAKLSTEVLREALFAAAHLGDVYPQSRDKVPLFKGCKCRLDGCPQVYDGPREKRHVHATRDANVIRQWHAAGLLRKGYGVQPADELVVFDVDMHEGGSNGLAAWGELVQTYRLPETATAITGSGNGLHVWFKLPDGARLHGEGFAGSAQGVFAGIDLVRRGGTPWQVAGVGSLHPSGGTYRWQHHPEAVGIAELPAALVERLRTILRKDSPGPTRPGPKGGKAARLPGDRQPVTVRAALVERGLGPQRRHGTLLTLACELAANMATDAEIRAELSRAIEDRIDSPDGQYRGEHAAKKLRDGIEHARRLYPLTDRRRRIRRLRDAVEASGEFRGIAGETDRATLLAILREFYRRDVVAYNVSVRSAALLRGDASPGAISTAKRSLERLRGDPKPDGSPWYFGGWLRLAEKGGTHRPTHDYIEHSAPDVIESKARIEVRRTASGTRRPRGTRYRLNLEKVPRTGTDLRLSSAAQQDRAVDLYSRAAIFTRHAAARHTGIREAGARILALLDARPSWRNATELAKAAGLSADVVRGRLWALEHLRCCDGRKTRDKATGRLVPCDKADGVIRRRKHRIELVPASDELLRILDHFALVTGQTRRADAVRTRVIRQRARHQARVEEWAASLPTDADVAAADLAMDSPALPMRADAAEIYAPWFFDAAARAPGSPRGDPRATFATW